VCGLLDLRPALWNFTETPGVYRILPALAADGLVIKDGRGWKPKDTAQHTPPGSGTFRGLDHTTAAINASTCIEGAPAGQPWC
jgi:hypothetical protein